LVLDKKKLDLDCNLNNEKLKILEIFEINQKKRTKNKEKWKFSRKIIFNKINFF